MACENRGAQRATPAAKPRERTTSSSDGRGRKYHDASHRKLPGRSALAWLAGGTARAPPHRRWPNSALQRFAVSARNQNGTPDTQAGSHPYALTTTLRPEAAGEELGVGGDLKDVRLELPPGFVGDPNATPHCSYQEFIRCTR